MAYHPITIQRLDQDTEQWTDVYHLHALRVNKALGASEGFNAGADQYHPSLTFTLAWCKAVENMAYNPQIYRLIYQGRTFNIVDYDDYNERHKLVRLVGVCYVGENS